MERSEVGLIKYYVEWLNLMKIDHLITPYKLGWPVIRASGTPGAFDGMAVDCAFPFRHNGKFYMTYVGFDGIGYQTALAVSDNLTDWEHKGVILARGGNMAWDSVGMAGTCLLLEDYGLYGSYKPKKLNGKYWMLYHAYPGEGYETGPAAQGLAYTDDEELLDWKFVGQPIFTRDGGGDWEVSGLYKGFLLEHGGVFYMFYNAKNPLEPWLEQIGVATSADLTHWERYPGNPVLPVTPGAWDCVFSSDPCVWYDGVSGCWAMFYYGFDGRAAMDGVAVSRDLLRWEKFPAPILTIGGAGALDSRYAHKPGIIYHDGALYHFYCACREYRPGDGARNFGDEFRCISVARSAPWRVPPPEAI